MDLRGLEKPRLICSSDSSCIASCSASVSEERNAAPSEPQEHLRLGSTGRNPQLHWRRRRTCIFSVGHLENLEDVDTLLQAKVLKAKGSISPPSGIFKAFWQVTNKQVEAVDLASWA